MATLSDIAPDNAALNDANFDLVATGTGFTATSKIQVDGVVQPTTFVSATELKAAVSPRTADSVGVRMVRVEEPAGTFTSELPFTWGIAGDDGGQLVEAEDPAPYEFHTNTTTRHLSTVVGTVGWPDGIGPRPPV